MRIAALILGVVGGVFGILSSILALGIGGIGSAISMPGASTVVGLGWSALGFCLLGFLGSGVVMARHRLGGLVLLIAAIGFTISISYFAVVAAPLFLIASILAFFAPSRQRRERVERLDTSAGQATRPVAPSVTRTSHVPDDSAPGKEIEAEGWFSIEEHGSVSSSGPRKVLLVAGGGVALFVVVAFVAIVAGGNRTSMDTASLPPAATAGQAKVPSTPISAGQVITSPSPAQKPTATTVSRRKMGDVITAGNWTYQVTKADRQPAIQWSQFGNQYTAKGIWQIVHVRIQNIGKETYPINSWDFEISDDAGTTYKSAMWESVSYSEYNRLSKPADQYPPGVPAVIGILFDVNPQAKGLRLHLVQAKQMVDLDQGSSTALAAATATPAGQPQATSTTPVVPPSTDQQLQATTPSLQPDSPPTAAAAQMIPPPPMSAAAPPPPTIPPMPSVLPWPAAPAQTPSLQILGSYSYEAGGRYNIGGQVQNNSDTPAGSVKVVATLRDTSGGISGTDYTYTALDVIPARGKSPFGISVQNWAGTTTFQLQVQGRAVPQGRNDVVIQDHRAATSSGNRVHIIGTAKNNGSTPAQSVKVVATVFDNNGKMIGWDYTYTKLDTLAPGGTSPFDISIQRTQGFQSYELQIQGR